MTPRTRFQFVWWDSWFWGFGSPVPATGPDKGCVIRWTFYLGPLEIRRWGTWPGDEW